MPTMAAIYAYDGCRSCIRQLLFVQLLFVHTTDGCHSYIRLGQGSVYERTTAIVHLGKGLGWYDMAYTCMNEKSFVHMTGLGVEYAVVAAMYIL